MKLIFALTAALVCAAVPAFAVPVTVTVVGPDNRPLPSANIRVMQTDSAMDIKSRFDEKAGTNGVFVWDWEGDFDAIPTVKEPRQILRVITEAPGMVTETRALRAAQTTIVMQPARAWSGLVFDHNQQPLAGVQLKLSSVEPLKTPDFQADRVGLLLNPYYTVEDKIALTDATGRWTLAGLPATGSARVAVEDARFVRQSFELAIGAGDAAPIYLKEGGAVTGVLLTPDGKPVVGEQVRAGFGSLDAQVKTDATGRFTIAGIAPGETRLYVGELFGRATKDGKLPEFLFSEPTAANIEAGKTVDVGEIKAVAGVLVRARVIDAVTKKPLANAKLGRRYSSSLQNNNDDAGNLSARVLPVQSPSPFDRLSIQAEGYPDYEIIGALLDTKEATLDLGTIEMKRGTVLTGNVRIEGNDDTSRLPSLSLSREGKTEFFSPTKDGQFQSKPLEAGSYNLNLNQRNNDWQIVAPRTVVVPAADAANKPVEVVVKRLTPFLPLIKEARGRLLDADGQGVAGATISARLRMESGSFYTPTALTDANGDYVFKSGSGDVVGAEVSAAEHPNYIIGDKTEVSVRDGIATFSGLIAKKRGAIFAGRVVGTDGQPAANAWVGVVEARDYEPVQTGADGAFQMADVPLDKFTLLAAQERDWARLPVASSAKNVQIELQKSPVVENRDAAIAQLLSIKTGIPTDKLFANWEVLGADLTERYIGRNGPPNAEVVAMFGAEMARREPAAFLKRAPEFVEAATGEARENLEAQLNILRAQSDDAGERTDANAWLDEQKLVKREINARSVTRLLQMAAVARNLKREDASQWLDYAAAVAAQLGGDKERSVYTWTPALTALNYESLVKFAEGWKVSDEFRLWSYVAQVWARAGEVQSARQALARMESLMAQPEMIEAAQQASKNRRVEPAGTIDMVRGIVAGALASSDAPAAFELATQVKEVYPRVKSLLQVADKAGRGGDAKVVEKALRAVMDAPTGNLEFFARAASIGAQTDAQLGRELFARAREKALPDEKRRGGFSSPSIGTWAFYHAPFDPAQSRVLLEREWEWRLPAAIKGKDESFSSDVTALYELVKGMAAVDAARAAQMQAIADAIETKSYGKTAGQFDLAVIALATPAQRARFGVDARY